MAVDTMFLTGPTAVGKSEVALLLAETLGGEIISVDSMQVYRGMDIGTAKPSAEERRRIPHHLLDVLDVSESFDGAQFARLAHAAVEQIRARGHLPIFCGGTGLYFKAFLEGLGNAPPANAELRAELERIPTADLLAELEQKDPDTFGRIDRQNPRRVIRAVEVIRLTGRPFSEQRARWGEATEAPANLAFFGLHRERDDLHERINRRVETMFRRGLVAETEALLQSGLEQNKVASQALGYRQVIDHLRRAFPLAQTIELVKLRTRQFAKRQNTWFRHQLPVKWIELGPTPTAAQIATQIAEELALPPGR
jgi:tRNA dimethylallyltransferase